MSKKHGRLYWSEAETFKFLGLIRKHPQLWDHDSPHFRNQFQRDLALDAIAYEMGITNAWVKRKMHTMRSQYLTELKKMKNRNLKEPIWPFFNAAKFFYESNKADTDDDDDNNESANDKELDNFDEDTNSQLSVDEENISEDADDDVEDEKRFMWTETKTLKLLELYRQYPLLYNTKSADYANKYKRQETLKEIAKQMETNVNTIRKKIHVLRSTFTTVVKRMQKRNLQKPTWPLFDKVKFLYTEDVYSPRNTYKMSTAIDNSCNENYNDNNIEYLMDEDIIDESEDVMSVNQNVQKLETFDGNKPTTCIACEERDEFTIFGETVATELRLTKDYTEIHELLKQQILEAVKEAKESIEVDEQ